MRIVFVIPYYVPAISFGGPITVAAALAEDLIRDGHRVTVLTTDVASRSARLHGLRDEHGGVSIRRLRNVSQYLAGRANLYTPLGAMRALDELLTDCDLLHVFDYFTWLTYRAVERAAKRRIPTVLSPHGSLSLDSARGRTLVKTLWQRTLGTATLERATVLHALSATEARTFRALGVANERVRIIPNGTQVPTQRVDATAFRARYGLGSRNIVLFVGRLLSGKGVDLLLAAAQRGAADRELAYVLVGPSENRPDLATAGWLTPNVLLTGLLHGGALEEAYAAATFFVLPSFSEALPMSALEALARGLPCLLSTACNLSDVEEHGAGLCIEPNLESLEAGIATMRRRAMTESAMGARGRKLVEEHYSLAATHSKMKSLYRELLGAKP